MRSSDDPGSGLSAAEFGHADTRHADNGLPDNWWRRRLAPVPRPLRFLAVGGLGLVADLAVFTAIPMHAQHPLAARIASLACATVLTWRLNRALTFAATGRSQRGEALRYAGVTAAAQGTSFAIFSLLALTLFAWLPQAALVAGAAVGAAVSYAGHLLIAFAPVHRSFKTENRA